MLFYFLLNYIKIILLYILLIIILHFNYQSVEGALKKHNYAGQIGDILNRSQLESIRDRMHV